MAKLPDTKFRNAKAKDKPYKVFDEQGLFLIVQPTGARWWRQRYRWAGKEQTLSLGTYPDVGLADAREKGAAIRKQVANQIDPSASRKEVKAAVIDAKANSLKAVTLEWIERQKRDLSVDHIERTRRRFEQHAFPWIGNKPIADVDTDDVLACLKRLEDRNKIDTAHRLLKQLSGVFRFAIVHKRAKHNPAAAVTGKDTLPPVKVKHHPSIKDPVKLAPLLRAIDAYDGSFVVRCALKLAPMLFVRPGELRHADWQEFKLDGKEPEWRIPGEKMKMGEQHIVPLPSQAVAILRELYPLTGPTGYVFPANRNPSRPMSENTLNVALRALGYDKAQVSAHGFRSTASTLLNEQGWHRDAIERQLAHGERDKVRASYNSAEHLPERRRMMAHWSQYLDGLKSGAHVVTIKRAKRTPT